MSKVFRNLLQIDDEFEKFEGGSLGTQKIEQ